MSGTTKVLETEEKQERRPEVVTTDVPAEASEAPNPDEKPEEGEQAAAGETGSKERDESAPSDSDNPKQPEKKKRDRRSERKIRRMSRALNERDAKIAELQRQLEAQSEKIPKPPKPKIEDFTDGDAYIEAVEAWRDETKPAPKPAKGSETPYPHDPEDVKAFHEVGKERLGDAFDKAATNQSLELNHTMGELLIDDDLGPEMYVYLNEHQDEASEIARLGAVETMRRMMEIRGKVDGQPSEVVDETGKKPKKKGRQSKAPPPGPDIEGDGGAAEGDPTKLSPEAYRAWRKRNPNK